MLKSSLRIVLVVGMLIVSLILFSACTAVDTPVPTALSPDSVYTQAVQTVAAALTEAALTPSLAPVTPLPEDPALPTGVTLPAEVTITPTTGLPEPATATATEAPTTPPTATLTPASHDPRNTLGQPTWRDTFDNAANWGLYSDAHVSFEIEDGQMVMVASGSSNYEGWTITWANDSDFYVETTAHTGTCNGGDRYGIMLRMASDASEGYLYGATCDGRYSLRRWDGDSFETYVPWTTSPYLAAGSNQTNRLGVMAVGDSFRLYINGSLVHELEQDEYSQGNFGIFVGSVNTTDFTVRLDELAYWRIEP